MSPAGLLPAFTAAQLHTNADSLLETGQDEEHNLEIVRKVKLLKSEGVPVEGQKLASHAVKKFVVSLAVLTGEAQADSRSEQSPKLSSDEGTPEPEYRPDKPAG